jgi:MoaA/NifB/PqqE/SkfB family radical SAM enzyme
MGVATLAGRLLDTPLGSPLLAVANWLLWQDRLRGYAFGAAERWLQARLVKGQGSFLGSRRIERERTLLALAILDTACRLIERRALSPSVTRASMGLWARAALREPGDLAVGRRFRARFGSDPPWFIVISPGHACNLHCTGCYANSGQADAHLPYATLERIISEANELWGAPLVVVSGGEPLAYRSEGHDVLDAVEGHPECMFLLFTNGTLIDRQVADRLAHLGNLTVALSVEGLRERTDQRRGAGCFARVLEAMGCLRQAGVPFGISATATRWNCQEILSAEFLDLMFCEQGAFYAFLFHYMPIGRNPDLDLMPTPEQRMEFWRRSWEVVEEKRIFLFDFWNSGPLAQGCLAAGREGGYIHVDWNGQVMPCVFAPYSVANIEEVYARGGTLNDVWQAPFFAAIRNWQRHYGYGDTELSGETNWLRPCPMRDHHAVFNRLLQQYEPDPQDEGALKALVDPEYAAGLARYGERLRQCSQPIWEDQYLKGGGNDQTNGR